jgi:hypothetical protein
MSNGKLRRQITFEAARLIYIHQESEYYRAKMTAARRLGQRRVKYADLPTNREIRDEIQSLARIGDALSTSAEHEEHEALGHNAHLDRFGVYRMLLVPLETVLQSPDRHPEGDALYHSLQVFDLARDSVPYDEEFQVAALLHDVGKAIDPRDHIAAALEALEGHITERTAWFILHHADAAALREGTLGVRARRRLETADDFDELMLLRDCDLQGRKRGVPVPDVDDAIEHLRAMSRENGALENGSP